MNLPFVSAASSSRRSPSVARSVAVSAAGLLLSGALPAVAETYNLGVGGTWNAGASWNPSTIPNSIGASAIFNGAATGSNPDQTANRPVTLDGTQTVGSIVFNNDAGAFTNSITTGTTGSRLTMDAADPGPATLITMGGGTGNNTLSVATTVTDSLRAIVNNTTASSGAGSLNLTAAISGPGGITKEGDGVMTFGTGAKTYTGPTVLNGGRTRCSLIARPTATSSFTINAGAQLTLIAAGSYTFGSEPLNLNGTGAAGGPQAAFPGAIRNDTNLAVTITNAVTLQSDTLLHIEGSTTGAIILTNTVSGPGRLTLSAPGSSSNQGTLTLNGNNSYSGGTLVHGGTLLLGSAAATLGTGDVRVDSSAVKISIASGVLNGIANTATLTLDGGGAAGVADFGFADLGAGVNEVVSGLVLGGATMVPGTYGSFASAATFQSDEFFTGSGIITVLPALTPLVLTSFGPLSGNTFPITWASDTNSVYRVDTTPDLAQWAPGSNIAGQSPTTTFTNTVPPQQSRRFYRVVRVSP